MGYEDFFASQIKAKSSNTKDTDGRDRHAPLPVGVFGAPRTPEPGPEQQATASDAAVAPAAPGQAATVPPTPFEPAAVSPGPPLSAHPSTTAWAPAVPPPPASPGFGRPPGPPLSGQWSFAGRDAKGTPKIRVSVVVGLVIVLVAGAASFVFLNRSPGGTVFAFTMSNGQNFRYRIHMLMDGHVEVGSHEDPLALDLSETLGWQVASVDSHGLATVDMTVSDVSGRIDGHKVSNGQAATTRIVLARDGRIVQAGDLSFSGDTASGPGMMFPGSDQFTPLLPDHPVKPGDRWSKAFDQDFPFADGALHYGSQNVFLRYEVIHGVRAAVIASTITMPMNITLDVRRLLEYAGLDKDAKEIPSGRDPKIAYRGSASTTQNSWFDPRSGQVVKTSSNGQFDMTVEFQGLPADTILAGVGGVRMTGAMNLEVTRLTAPGASPTSAPGAAGAAGASKTERDHEAQSLLRDALAAAKVHFAGGDTYLGFTPKKGSLLDPALTFNTASPAVSGQVSIRGVTDHTLVLVTRSASGAVFCLAEDGSGHIHYGTKDATKAAGCTGAW